MLNVLKIQQSEKCGYYLTLVAVTAVKSQDRGLSGAKRRKNTDITDFLHLCFHKVIAVYSFHYFSI